MWFLIWGMVCWQRVKDISHRYRKVSRRAAGFALIFLVVVFVCLAGAHPALCQDQPPDKPEAPGAAAPADVPAADETPAMFAHSESSRFWISGQANFITQWHSNFHSPYQGPNSLPAKAQDATSRVLTLFLGVQLNDNSEVLLDMQET